jgi:DNA-binding MarR family transcriptional regulator
MIEWSMTELTQEAALELAQHLRLTINRLRRVVRAASIIEAVSRPQEAALSWLNRQGPLTIADLARWEQVRPQTMGTTVAGLLHAGLVSKAADPADGRREIISLTRDGRARLHEIAIIRERDLADMLAVRLTDADRRALERTLAVLDSLTSNDESSVRRG